MEISVVIPAYNEASVIRGTIDDVQAYMNNWGVAYEIILVDDGSTDTTADAVRALPAVTLITNEVNRGKGYSVRRGVLAATGDLILFMDADNSTKIRELDRMRNEIASNDIVIGSRALASSRITVRQNIAKVSLGRMGNTLIRFVLGLPFKDTQCGFKLFRRKTQDIFKVMTLDRWGFDFELLFLASKRQYRILESPVVWENNFDSKVRAASYFSTFFDMIRVRIRYLMGNYKY
ncbi:MAG: dolichyl-phosphate beta-glucosyltransferase [Patescibacteria group bacterium]